MAKQNILSEAIDHFKLVPSSHALYDLANYNIGWCHYNQKDYDNAIVYFEKISVFGQKYMEAQDYIDLCCKAQETDTSNFSS